MRAVIAEGHNRVSIVERDQPAMAESECLIKVSYAGINRADLLQVAGQYPPPPGESDILGLEFSGVIVKVGRAVHGFSEGDVVFTIVASGAYADYISVEASHLIHKPSNITTRQAGAIAEAFITSFQALKYIAQILEDDKVLIHAGASGVGSAAIQMAKKVGSYVVCTASLAKHEYCKELGADKCVNYKKVDFDQVVSKIDMVLDLVGGSYFQKNLKVMAPDARMVMLGFLGGVKTESTNVAAIVTKRLKIEGSTLRSRSLSYKKDLIRKFSDNYLKNDSFPFRANVDKVFDFKNVRDAHQYMRENKNRGKIILKVNG